MGLLPAWPTVQFGWELPSFTSHPQEEDQWGGSYLVDSRGHFVFHTVTSWSWAGVLPGGRNGYSQLWDGVLVVARD